MAEINLLTVEMQMNALETEVIGAYQEYEREEIRIKHSIKLFIEHKNDLIEYSSRQIEKKIERYEHFQQFLYRLAINIVKNKVNLFLTTEEVKLYDKKIKELEAIIILIDDYEEENDSAISSLEKLKEFLLNSIGGEGYVELNSNINNESKAKTNIQLLDDIQKRIEIIEKDNIEDKSDKRALTKLSEYIKSENDYWNEIKKIGLMINKFKKKKKYLPNEKKYYQDTLNRSKDLIVKKNAIIDNIKNFIKNDEEKIIEAINKQEIKDVDYYRDSVNRLEGWIKDGQSQQKKQTARLYELEQGLSKLQDIRRHYIEKASSFKPTTSSRYIDQTLENQRANEEKIRRQKELIENQKDRIKKIENNLEKNQTDLAAKRAERSTAQQSFEIFINTFWQDYNNIDIEIQKQFEVIING